MKDENYSSMVYNNSYMPRATFEPNQNFTNTQFTNNDLKYQYLTDIMNDNIGKVATIYVSFPDSIEWRDKYFTGTIKSIGRDYILIQLLNSNKNILILSIYINYIEF